MRLRILSYNIQKGQNLRTLKAALRNLELDLVFLQEIRGAPVDQPERIADSLWPHYAYGKNAVYSKGHHGNAILSKYPFRDWENVDLSVNTRESRGVLLGKLTFPRSKQNLNVFCTHLNLLERDRRRQILKLCHAVQVNEKKGAPVLLCGDFNDWRVKATDPIQKKLGLKEVFAELHRDHAATFPVWFPLLQLDRIYYRGLKLRYCDVLLGKPWSQLSDHAAIMAEFEI